MKRLHTLKRKLSLTIALACLVTVVSIVLLSNLLANRQFGAYLVQQQEKKTQDLLSTLWLQYHQDGGSWNEDSIHAVGMYALYDGFFIKVYDAADAVVWDALFHDMSACTQIMEEIQDRMEQAYPQIDSQFTSSSYSFEMDGQPMGTVEIGYLGPFFLSEQDFNFISNLNTLFLAAGMFSLLVAVALGGFLSIRLSRPILRAADVSAAIADGDYQSQIEEQADTVELDRLITSVNHLASALNQQELLRKRLTADVAHELRTPLTTVATHLEAMAEGIWEPSEDRLNSCLEEINRISGLVADLENLAHLENQLTSLSLRNTLCWPVIDKCLDSLSLLSEEKKLTVKKSGPELSVPADAGRLHQVVYNLLSNAVKYTPKNGVIQISLWDAGDEVALSIQDSGIGIAEQDLPHIFERFYRADSSRSRATGGSGIGLAIVTSIIKAHKGRVEVESQLGEGSIFTVYLPASEQHQPI